MPINQQEAIKLSVKDLSSRLQTPETDVTVESSESADFANACLEAARAGEMCADMMLTGWRINLRSAKTGQVYEYRAAKNQLRLFGFNGQNYKVWPL